MKKYLLTLGILLSVSLTANAYVDSQYTITEQYMLNSGYSSEISRLIKTSSRDPYAPTDDIYPKYSLKKLFKQFWKKIDPTAFPEENFLWHDIKYTTGIYDMN